MQPDSVTIYDEVANEIVRWLGLNEYVTGERDYYADLELREWMFAQYYDQDYIDDIDDSEADV